MKKYDTAVVVGRFQIPHKAHIDLINFAHSLADEVLVIIGSVNSPRTTKNPFTFTERSTMLRNSLASGWSENVVDVDLKIRGIEDNRYNNNQWMINMRNIIETNSDGKRALVGHHKDDSSFYLDMFPEMAYEEFDNVDDLNSTDIRNALFEDGTILPELPHSIIKFIEGFKETNDYDMLVDEYRFIKQYRQIWEMAPYPVIFNTVDAVVLCAGHILMITRRNSPCKGQWALPGGFINQSETLEEAVYRELLEETRIKVSRGILKDKVRTARRDIFDDPTRSLRGRTITVAFLIELNDKTLPKVKGSDDAEKAFWVPLNTVLASRDRIYEDHVDIIHKMTGGI